MIKLVTVSDDRFGRKGGKYEETQEKIKTFFEQNREFGIDSVLSYTWNDVVKNDIYQYHKTILDNIDAARNGRAYKPMAIMEALESVNENDYVIYSDCSPEMWDRLPFWQYQFDISVITDLCDKNGGVLSAFVKWDTRTILQGHLGIHTHDNFTTDRCMKVMGLENLRYTYMHASGMMVFKKTAKTIAFVNEWLKYNFIDECASLGSASIENDYSFWDKEENYKMGHRHDQSISGLLINKYGYKLVDMPYFHDLNPHNFINYCRVGHTYNFIDPLVYKEKKRVRKGDKVINSKGVELSVFEIRNEGGEEKLIVGLHRESTYAAIESELKIK